MGKLLRVLVIFFLVLSAGALTLGILLFNKRELLKGRTQRLERAVEALGFTIEEEAAKVDIAPNYPAADISPCTSEVLDTPERSQFWDSYKPELELPDQLTMDISKRRKELMSLYKKNPVTGKDERNPNTGYKITEGPGTMQGLLTETIEKAGNQLARLNATRQMLSKTRMELVETIGKLNTRKDELRNALKKIDDLNAEIARLNGEIRNLKATIADLEAQKRVLEDQIAEQRLEITRLTDENKEKDAEIERLRKENDDLRGKLESGKPVVGVTEPIGRRLELMPGKKGEVIAMDPEWNFVVIKLDDAFVSELVGEDPTAPLPPVTLMVRRPGTQEFVSKIRLIQVRDENLGIADIMSDWQQLELQSGDEVFH